MSRKLQVGNKRSPLLNGLRGLAVLLVLGYHFDVPLFGYGYWGVDLFFWLSGLLITGGFLREYDFNRQGNRNYGWIDVRYYFLRRARRLLPLSLLVLGLVTVVTYFSSGAEALSQTLRRIPRILTFTLNMQLQSDSQDYFQKTNQDFGLLHYWSLSVEEQIYFLSPFLFLFAVSFHGMKIFGRKINWYQRVLGLNIILSIGSFIFMLRQNQIDPIANYYSTFSRFWQFGLGAVIAIFLHINLRKFIPRQFIVYLRSVSSLVLLASLMFLENDGFGYRVAIPLVAISVYVLLNLDSQNQGMLTRVLHLKIFQFLGDIAFSLYLIHWPAMMVLRRFPDQSSLFNIFVYICALIVISYGLYVFVEKPTMMIDISRFKTKTESGAILSTKNTKRFRRSISVILCFLLIPITVLSYPQESKEKFNSILNVFSENRYGITTEDSSPQETIEPYDSRSVTSNPSPNMTNDKLPEVSPSSASPVDPQAPSSKEAATKKSSESWFQSIRTASKVPKAKESVITRHALVLEELKKSWFSGCLDSKSPQLACVLGNGENEVVLVGDSFSFALRESFALSIPETWRVRILTKGSCLPWALVQYEKSGAIKLDCADHAAWVNDYIAASKPKMVIATGADQSLLNSSFDDWKAGFQSTVKFYSLNSDRVVIVSPAPGSGNLKQCVGSDLSLTRCFGTPSTVSRFVGFQNSVKKTLGYEFINLTDYLCSGNLCPAIVFDTSVYADGQHLSDDFAKKFSKVVRSLNLFD